ncbi:MAG: ATP-binding protein [Clostridiales bacterium]|nr:ATP-binding protein [Clostridiales bacterium]
MHNSHVKRYLEDHIKRDLEKKIVLVSGPRQVGKTTLSRQLLESYVYLNFDSGPDREMIRKLEWDRKVRVVIFDELHKMKNWKSWLKGIYDTEGIPPALLITGSARLDLYRRGGDSLAGRFFSYRLHPLTVREICTYLPERPEETVHHLLRLGGFPEPYLGKDEEAARRWRSTHIDTIIRQDLLDLEKIRDLKSVEILIDLLRMRVRSPVSYTSLARDLQVSPHTIQHWLQVLEQLCIVFPVRPYHRNIARSILKEPKYYFYDVGDVKDSVGARFENLVATALLRELHLLEDTTGRKTALHYLRDKEKREVDFLATIDGRPVLMVEAKAAEDSFEKSLFHFRRFLPDVRAVQVVFGLRRRKSSKGVEMVAAHEFLEKLKFTRSGKVQFDREEKPG